MFDVFVTMDKGIPHQQNAPKLGLVVAVLRARSNALEDLEPLADELGAALVDRRREPSSGCCPRTSPDEPEPEKAPNPCKIIAWTRSPNRKPRTYDENANSYV